MGVSADEIDRHMKQSREHIDENLGVLEQRATRDQVRRYAGIVAVVLGVTVLAGAGVLIYRGVRGRTRREQLKATLMEGLKDLPDSIRRIPSRARAMRRAG